MSEDKTQTNDAARAGPMAGERLAEARRLRQISLPDIARELHLDEPKVQALEENRFDILGAPVFAKGHLRKYAEMVGVSADAVMADYRALTNADVAPPVVGEVRQRPRDINLAPWLIAIPLVLIISGAVYWWLGRAPQAEAPPAGAAPATTGQLLPRIAEPEPAADETQAGSNVAEAQAVPANEVAGLPAATPPGTGAALAEILPVTDNAAPQGRPAAVAGQVDLRLVYSGDCWTEVTDAGGRRLFFDLGKNGRTVNVSGRAPLRVLLGDSNNVRLTVNGKAFAIENAEFRGDTARLTINE